MNNKEVYNQLKKGFKYLKYYMKDLEDSSEEQKILEFKNVFINNFKDMFIKDKEFLKDMYSQWLHESFYNTEEWKNLDPDCEDYDEKENLLRKNYEQKSSIKKFLEK